MYSIREIFRIGRGPSSSHTMAPSNACLTAMREVPYAERFEVYLYGSLAKTGKGHRTDYAIKKTIGEDKVKIFFDEGKNDLPHPNTMCILAYNGEEKIYEKTFLSVGGGTIIVYGEKNKKQNLIYREAHFSDIEAVVRKKGIGLDEYVFMNEGTEIKEYLYRVLERMRETINIGINSEGVIPGGLKVKRKAKILFDEGNKKAFGHEKEIYMMSAFAYAASEENACGEMMVTAPTCGASGVLPAVLMFKQIERGYSDESLVSAIAVAGIIGNLIKHNASISGAECGCQAELGSACAMAAAAFAFLKGLNLSQIECSAEIALEHHLGLTCDPINGLVQIPCIERNAAFAMRAVDAVSLAEMLHDKRKISLDSVIETMYNTGRDIPCIYRETSEGGLAKLKIVCD
ncbi:MAG: L-serine ammonia-lyase, iron-sulfur-dependent, subunit alpha [Clostridia bacterium]|nr:L-serine ammonia-lyase, iron-sulfur-dependent, subunit alpha [Clostridia bacterium]